MPSFVRFATLSIAAVHRTAVASPDVAASLPDVESVLTKATNKAHDFAEQARAMQRRLAQQQEKSRAALSAQKATYESKLGQQMAQSDAINANNTVIEKSNAALHNSNRDLETELQALQANNAQMRQVLQTIDAKVGAAKLFIEDSLKVTDDSDAEDLKVLAPTTPKPTLDHFLAVAGGDKIALLQFSSPRSQGPGDLVSVLSKSLADIATAEVEGAAELKAHFLANFEDGRKRQEALNATQTKLLEIQEEFKEHNTKLLAAKGHLESTGKQLRERLQGLRVFARKVDAVAAPKLRAGTPESQQQQQQQQPTLAASMAKRNETSGAVSMTKPKDSVAMYVAPAKQDTHATVAPVAPKKQDVPATASPVPQMKLEQLQGAKATGKMPAKPTSARKPEPKAAKPVKLVKTGMSQKTAKKSQETGAGAAEGKKAATKTVEPKKLTRESSAAGAGGSAPQSKRQLPDKRVRLIQSSATQQKPKAEEPSQWTKWLSALR